MNRFIKLSQCVLNTNHISHIVIKPSNFQIKMNIYDMNGQLIFGSSGVSTVPCILDIDEKTNPTDYQTIEKWIRQINTTKY
jgi:hypothetical protein